MRDTRLMLQKNITEQGVFTAEEIKQEVNNWKLEKRKTGMAFNVKSEIETSFVHENTQYMYIKVFYSDHIAG